MKSGQRRRRLEMPSVVAAGCRNTTIEHFGRQREAMEMDFHSLNSSGLIVSDSAFAVAGNTIAF
jgi:hypothetical protein